MLTMQRKKAQNPRDDVPAHREGTLGVSEVARLFGVDPATVKHWAFHFRSHLTQGANPPKGMPRRFTPEDLPVLAYVFYHWEEEPDLVSIDIGLNWGNHLEEPFRDVGEEATPLFQDPPLEMDESWRHGSLIGGMTAGALETFALAESYKLAGDILVEAALTENRADDIVYPILYTYRHSLELFLKAVTSPRKKKRHDLLPLLQALRLHIWREHGETMPPWFENAILSIYKLDPDSTAFRYGDEGGCGGGEFWVDLRHARKIMGWIGESFQRVQRAKLPEHFRCEAR